MENVALCKMWNIEGTILVWDLFFFSSSLVVYRVVFSVLLGLFGLLRPLFVLCWLFSNKMFTYSSKKKRKMRERKTIKEILMMQNEESILV
jgi:hypothetical protein